MVSILLDSYHQPDDNYNLIRLNYNVWDETPTATAAAAAAANDDDIDDHFWWWWKSSGKFYSITQLGFA